MADYWLKLYIEILEDPKMALLPDRIWRRVIELFLLAKRENKGGWIPETRKIAWALRIGVEQIDDLEFEMQQIWQTGIIEKVVDGWLVKNFTKRQEAANSAERSRRSRERGHKKQYYGDINATDVQRNVAQSRAEHSKAEVEDGGGGDYDDIQVFDPTPARLLYDAFLNASGLDETLIVPMRAWLTVEEWVKAGVDEATVTRAVTELQTKGMSMSGPWSITNAINIVKSRGATPARKPAEDW